MQIIAQAKNAAGRTVVIAQSASQSGGRRYGHFVNLRVVALPVGMTADGYRSLSQRGVEVLCDLGEADARSTGPKSRYAMRLERAWAAFGEVVGEAVASHARACNAVNVLLSDLRRLEAYKRFDDVLYTQYIADLQPRLNSAREKLAAAEAALAA